MSRLAKKPIVLAAGVHSAIDVEKRSIEIKGPKGTLKWSIPKEVVMTQEKSPSGQMAVKVALDPAVGAEASTGRVKALLGLSCAKVRNMMTGVVTGFQKEIDIQGVGFKAQAQGKTIVFNLGMSHPLTFDPPEGVTITVSPKLTGLTIVGIDRDVVGQVASTIRSFRPPEPYKVKGIRYLGEVVRRKAGKAASAGAGGKK